MEPVVALVVAAGSGVRLGGERPKALRELNGKALVARSMDALAAGGATHAVVVVGPGLQDEFATALADAPIPFQLVPGGSERQDSVGNGLSALSVDPALAACRVVLVHDAARALVPPLVVERVIAAVEGGAAVCIPVVPVIDTIRELTADGSRVVDRTRLRAVQTPQGFDRSVLITAHARLRESGLQVTDDAAAAEVLGYPVAFVEGSRESIKITEPLDLVIAEAIERSRS